MRLSARQLTPLTVGCVLVALLLVAPAASASGALNETPDKGMPYVNGPVRAVASGPDGTTYIGGSFTYIGPRTGAAVVVDPVSGQRYTRFAQVQADDPGVTTVIPDGRGGFFFAGSFYIGKEWRVLVHLRADGSFAPGFRPHVYDVNSLALSGHTLFVGGHFTSIDGRPRYNLVALDAATGRVKGWNAHLNGGRVGCLAVAGRSLFAGGTFNASIAGQGRRALAAFDVSTGRLLPFDAALPVGSDVRVLAVSDSRLYAAGPSSSAGTPPLLIAMDASSGAHLDWHPFSDLDSAGYGQVNAMEVAGSRVYVGGSFASVGGQERHGLAAVDATTGLVTAWDPLGPELYAGVNLSSLVVADGAVHVAGFFASTDGRAWNGAAAFDATTGRATAWDVGDPMSTWLWRPDYDSRYAGDGYVKVLAASSSGIFVGGEFSSICGSRRSNLAAIAPDGTLADWDPKADGAVNTLAVSGRSVYAGGSFRHVAGQRRDRIAAIDAVSGAVLPWDPGADGALNALAVSGEIVYAGGRFSTIGGSARESIAALGPDGAATSWNPGASGTPGGPQPIVRALVVSSSRVYVGGEFAAMGRAGRRNIAAIDRASGSAAAWNPGADKVVWTIALSGTRLYAGGSFTRLGGKARSRLGAIDPDSGAALPWNPRAGGAEADVRSFAILGQTLYAGGWFTSMGGHARHHLAAVSTGGGVVMPWRTSWSTGRIDALAASTGRFWAGESVRTGTYKPKSYLARFSQGGP